MVAGPWETSQCQMGSRNDPKGVDQDKMNTIYDFDHDMFDAIYVEYNRKGWEAHRRWYHLIYVLVKISLLEVLIKAPLVVLIKAPLVILINPAGDTDQDSVG